MKLNIEESICLEFDRRISEWVQNLASLIADARTRYGAPPVLIAISRKMPRLLNWILKEWRRDEYGRQKDEIRSAELTTEIALPFIVSNIDISQKRFIIIDDVLVHGSTLRSIIKFLKAVDADYGISILFTSDEAEIPDIEAAVSTKGSLMETEKCGSDLIDAYVGHIVSHIKETELPIDFEFPIFKSESAKYEELTEQIESNALENILVSEETYRIDENRYVCVFNNDIHDIADFLKIRFYRKSDSVIFEVFTPLVLESATLTSHSAIFTDDHYQQIWDKATGGIRNILRNKKEDGENWMNMMHLSSNSHRTLCMFANYLMAISFYNSVKVDLFSPESLADFRLSKEDLDLIVSKKTSDEIFEELAALIADDRTTRIFQKKLERIDDDFAPKSLSVEFENLKSELRINCMSQDEALRKFIEWQHYSNSKFQQVEYRYQRLLFGNTLASLNKIVDFYYQENMSISLNNWIDCMVDNGCLIPKYECLAGVEYGEYWRRYFEPGLNGVSYPND